MIAHVTLVSLFSLCLISNSYASESTLQPTAEIRAYIKDIQTTQTELTKLGAVFKSEYAFTDYIYQRKSTNLDLDKHYTRLRVYEKTNWNQKKYLLVHKIISQGLTGTLPVKKYFDSREQAEQELQNEYVCAFSFYRTGWEYSLDDNHIFVENIQYLTPTIEIVAPHKESIDNLFSKLSIDQAIEHSVPYLVHYQYIYDTFSEFYNLFQDFGLT